METRLFDVVTVELASHLSVLCDLFRVECVCIVVSLVLVSHCWVVIVDSSVVTDDPSII